MKRIEIQELWYAVEVRIWQEYDAYTGDWERLKSYVSKPYISDEECQQTIKEYLAEFYKDILENKKSQFLSDRCDWEKVEKNNYTLCPYFYWKIIDTVADGDKEKLQQKWE